MGALRAVCARAARRRDDARPAALHDGGLGRRRQEHADRAAAVSTPSRCSRTSSNTSPQASERRGGEGALDLALLTDGLRAEREQGITIDVAYRYFATPKRRFIIADCPGHQQYTRNMVTGASTADLAVVLLDARRACWSSPSATRSSARCSASRRWSWRSTRWTWSSTRRRASTSWRSEFARLRREAAGGAQADLTYIPISALNGDNVVERSQRDALV